MRKDQRVDLVVMAVQQSGERLTEQAAAQLVFLSASRFRSVMRENFGVGFRAYRLGVTMDRAKQLLTDKTKGIEEIAIELGYSCRAAFEHTFKRQLGMSPARYRKTIT